MLIIPKTSPVFHVLNDLAISAEIVIFSGLPGTGKSLYVNEFYKLAVSSKRDVTVVQWDIARKAFETKKIMEWYPMKDGMVHDAVILMAGEFLLKEIKHWYTNKKDNELLLIEAPLVGGRFIELVSKQDDHNLEMILSNDLTKLVMPIPSAEVRKIIEQERAKQVDDHATVWIGAKPSVMKLLWKHVCLIANEFGGKIEIEDQIPYDPKIVAFVFKKVARHRNFIPIFIDEVFNVPAQSEDGLHSLPSLQASEEEANHICDIIRKKYQNNESMHLKTQAWYLQ